MNNPDIHNLSKLLRQWILTMSTEAGSGHPSSSLSAVELCATLFFGGFFRFRVSEPEYYNNDRLIFSKGHASPLFYSLWAAAGGIEASELLTFRKFGSRLEGHPTRAFPFTEAPTGSLGQGLSIGVGMALHAERSENLSYRTYVLLGDSEMAEGSVWEAIACAAHYQLSSLIGVLDVNRLGQRGPTMLEHDMATYEARIKSFGWATRVIDGHDIEALADAYTWANEPREQPAMIIAKTLKGKGVSFIEDKDGWHGKTLSKEECARAITELGEVDLSVRGTLAAPEIVTPLTAAESPIPDLVYDPAKPVATRRAYGNALVRLVPSVPSLVVLDAEVSNSTYAELVKKSTPERFFEMFVAEQNMVGAAVGLARRGRKPCVSTFAAFFSRAYDQIRMSQYSAVDILFCGSHAGVSIGEDGASQMGLEDLALFRVLLGSTVLYPSDAISTERLVEAALKTRGITYLRTTRKETPILYSAADEFPIGGSKVLRSSDSDAVTIVAAGITLFEALHAHDLLKEEGILTRVIDLYSVKPIDHQALERAARETRGIVSVEDHFADGGLGEAVCTAVAPLGTRVTQLAVRKMPRSGTPDQLLDYEEITAASIITAVKTYL
ncbi:MAG: transketolase [Patescibacteria group bacterium]